MFIREKSVEYALKWAYNNNPNFYNFTFIGGDCTNFISQCLYFGGIEMNYNLLGWYYTSLSNRAPAWTGVNEFWDFAVNNNGLGVRIKECSLNDVEIADVIQLYNGYRYYHNLLVTEVNNGIIKVTAHDNNVRNIPLYYYNYIDIRCGKVLN